MSSFTVLVTAPHLLPEAQHMLEQAGGQVCLMDEPITEESLVDRLSKGDVQAILLRGSKPLTAKVLDAAKGLKIIAKNGAGIDSVDLEHAARRGISVAVAAGANADAVAEHSVALMLALVRNLNTLDQKVRQGGWAGASWLGQDFRGSTVGLVGFGSIGRSTARLASALGARVVVFSRTPTNVDGFETEASLDRLLARSDVLSLHCPLTEQTRGLIGSKELALLKKGAIVINTARGAVLDEAALVASLVSGHLGGAGLDTFESEPIATDNPLLKLDNVILTPHVAGVTRQAATRVATITAKNIIDAMTGVPLPKAHLVAGPAVPGNV